MQVGPDTGVPYVAHGESVHLVPGAFRVAGPVALADGGIETAAERQVQVHAAADSLKEQLVEQSGAHQPRVEGRKAAEVVVVEVERDELYRLEAYGQKAARQARTAGGGLLGGGVRLVGLQAVIDAEVALPGKRVLEEDEFAFGMPTEARNAESGGAGVLESVPRSAVEVEKCTDLLPVGAVVPRSGVGRGAGKHSDGGVLGNPPSNVSAIDGAQAGRPGQVHAAETEDPVGLRIVVSQSRVISPIEQVVQGGLRGAAGKRRQLDSGIEIGRAS